MFTLLIFVIYCISLQYKVFECVIYFIQYAYHARYVQLLLLRLMVIGIPLDVGILNILNWFLIWHQTRYVIIYKTNIYDFRYLPSKNVYCEFRIHNDYIIFYNIVYRVMVMILYKLILLILRFYVYMVIWNWAIDDWRNMDWILHPTIICEYCRIVIDIIM